MDDHEVNLDDMSTDEGRVAEMLRATRPEPPAGLEASIREAVLADRRDGGRSDVADSDSGSGGAGGWAVPRWALAAAAVAVIALGTFGIAERAGVFGGAGEGVEGGDVVDPLYVSLEASPSPWASADGRIAGDPVLDDLTDAALESLLADLGG